MPPPSDRTATIRPLTIDDLAAYRARRQEALVVRPEAFSATPADEARLTETELAARCAPVAPGMSLGAFDDGELIGMAAYVPQTGEKVRHKATMVAVYLKPAWRSAGVGRLMVEAIIAHAREQRVILQCDAAMHNLPARRLYHAMGFVQYGVERDALMIEGKSFDNELLMLDLRTDPPAE